MVNKQEQVQLAMLAEQAQRYPDMIAAMRSIAEAGDELSSEERNLLSVAYKHALAAHRSPWRTISNIEQSGKTSERQQALATKYRQKIEGELKDLCRDLLTLIDTHLLGKSKNNEAKIFYLKMKGDYCRYLAEVATDNERQKWAEESERAYRSGLDLSKEQLPATDPLRLGLILNFSVFQYEIANETESACRLAKEAFDEALAGLDTIGEDNYRDSTLIMQLLRDNLTVWAGDQPDEQD